MKTIICDIDGTLIYHHGTQKKQVVLEPKVLPGVIEKFHEWDKLGYNIILISGRRESTRSKTEYQLELIGNHSESSQSKFESIQMNSFKLNQT